MAVAPAAIATGGRPDRLPVLLLLLSFLVSPELVPPIHGQAPDSLGFISIDCGIPEGTSYPDPDRTMMWYVSDAGFVDAGAGANAPVSQSFVIPDLATRYTNVRYFFPTSGASAGGARSCYTLQGLTQGAKYFVRCSFYYGNYDGIRRPPAFDLYLGANRWATVNITEARERYVLEAVVVLTASFLQVCLVDIGLGTPFISGLDLRPLKAAMYPEATANQSLLLLSLRPPGAGFPFNRYYLWPSPRVFRYPFDLYDRDWQSYVNVTTWTNITTKATINVSNSSSFAEPPSVVMQSAATPVNGNRLDFSWSPDPSLNNNSSSSKTYLLVLYFAELQQLSGSALRQFDILIDGASWDGSRNYTPKYLSAEVVKRVVVQGAGQHAVSLVATPDATLPPILNAIEIYSVQQMTELGTNNVDAESMMKIRKTYVLKKNWMGDPCAPKAFAWHGLNCIYSSSGPAWITALNLSSSALTGPVDSSFGDLKSIQHLDLSNNSLSGPIPDFLGQMLSLIFLDLSSNKLSGSIPAALLEKRQNGSLVLRIGNNANICDNGASTCDPSDKKKNRKLIIAIAVPVAVTTLLFVAAIIILHRRRNGQDTWTTNNLRHNSSRNGSNLFENRRFSYKELKFITANFREEIGRGGFGAVFLGHLENENAVAVKIRSTISSQGDKEFLAEAQHLSRVHHKNLVSLIGYCKDKKHLALVYEYMHGGDLEDCLRGEASVATPLSWHRRLRIALDSAHGLEYLHKSCQPPLIHRDVKTKNILLTADLEAKISDFGLTKEFANEFMTHITTQPAGTLGYLDPEYFNTSRLSEKSDVYSFGVVLLELITGQPPAVAVSDTESIHIAQWVRQKLSEGNIESIADSKMGMDYDVNSVWKVTELALRCKEQPSSERPTMTGVVVELNECLELEMSRGIGNYSSVTTSALSAMSADLHSDVQTSDMRQKSILELGLEGNESAILIGPTTR
ncbi:receptor-like protein kinase At3g21340 isoform X2 [Brachypodium distachyon]|uniref:non-specific serine/threonine protein kinase n=1 Tax=Brachypodium distachyon TaxID=15368 RepID=A0A2K2CKB2_BRADI|nr:receptor-like protein kinase At3g21340 isoform X2 [Brachypodium distachyon]PNT62478.1 hypothetical protein BRADI_4g04060v3 [Brachypodium distachyon]|eukprot:XP_003579272.1 receptor-like protein kinase At3g21340 isoform X2 [Brachypodium distachyon]